MHVLRRDEGKVLRRLLTMKEEDYRWTRPEKRLVDSVKDTDGSECR